MYVPGFRRRLFGLFIGFGLLAAGPPAAAADTVLLDAEPHAEAMKGLATSFLARDLGDSTTYVLEGSDVATRHTPWSTFKIPNLIIALESGVSDSLESPRTWDAVRRPAAAYWPDAWKRDHTLGSAFAQSAVWYFQDVARDVGTATYRRLLGAWRYGNAEVPANSDEFWLDGSLRISVEEQVEFLRALLANGLDVSPEALSALDEASLAGSAGGVSLHGKTGAGPVDSDDIDAAFTGWYVGYLKRPDAAPVVFALHVAAPSFSMLRDFRRQFSVELLEDMGAVPPGAF
jgi:beta-lactamase class D